MVEIEILDVTQDQENGTIIVKTNYVVDGKEVVSNYPQLNGKYYWVTRYNTSNFFGLDDQGTLDKIFKDLKQFGATIISREYFKKANLQYIQDKTIFLVGQTQTITTADIQVSKDIIWVVSSDGTKQDKPTDPVVVTP